MDCTEFDALKKRVIAKLEVLDPKLTYHNLSHTLDVLEQSERIAGEEKIDSKNMYLLKVAALYHDTGFLKTYKNHEEMSCNLFLEDAADFHFTDDEKKVITGLIMATKVPQTPHNHLENIICDADLDYLGRDDFFSIGDELRKEFIVFGVVPDDDAWEKLQLNFLKNHHYFTESSRQMREPGKQQNFTQLV